MTHCKDSWVDTEVNELARHLDKQKAAQAIQFRDNIRACKDDDQKYDLCLDKRDQLYHEKQSLNIEFACYALIFTESNKFGALKTQELWKEFNDSAIQGSKNRERIEKELKKVADAWGEDLVHHCSFRERGIYFAIHLAAVAKVHTEWETQALPRFQQLARRRIQLEEHGRHKFTHSLEPTDLLNAKLWISDCPHVKTKDPEKVLLPLEQLSQDQLPQGYGLDRYGFLVPEASAMYLSRDCRGTNTRPIGEADSLIPRRSTEASDNTNASVAGVLGGCMPEVALTSTSDDATSATAATLKEAVVQDVNGQVTGCTAGGSSGAGGTTHDDIPLRRSLRTLKKAVVQDVNGQATFCTADGGSDAVRTAEDSIPLRRSLRTQANNIDEPPISGLMGPPLQQHRGRAKSSRQTPAQRNGAAASASVPRRLVTAQLKTLAGKLSHISTGGVTASPMATVVSVKRQRAASVPPDIPGPPAPKKYHFDCPRPGDVVGCRHDHNARPARNWATDETYLARAVLELCLKADKRSNTRGSHTAKVLLPILRKCESPNTNEKDGAIEVALLDGHQAKALLDSRTPVVPIITERQQHFQWRDPLRPISEFFEWLGDHEQMVSVQIPSIESNKCSHESHSIRQVHRRFIAGKETDDPWNVLDLGCPLPSTLPDFLTGHNCQLLAQVRQRVLNGDRAERTVASREDWAEWRDIERWALISEGGHCTAPHMDSHGLATWITIQQGLFGFVWMSRPTDKQREDWLRDPEHYDEAQQWRYCVLKPGQTIFFPSGTIHAVFRTRESQTFGLGGHILQWSGIAEWMDIVSVQVEFPDTTNENMSDAWQWVPVVKGLLQKRLERLGPS